MSSKWQDFEKFVEKFLALDRAKTTKGSGSVKHEEDVIGETLVVQCKQTDSKNSHILHQDVSRLLDAAETLDRFPLFLTNTQKYSLVSIPLTEETSEDILRMLSVLVIRMSLMKVLKTTTYDPIALQRLKASYHQTRNLLEELKNGLKTLESRCETRISSIEDDVQMYDLFDKIGG
jgi:hypothetical protein